MKTLEETGRDTPVVLPASQRLFSEEVGIAAADSPLPDKDPGYQFSNGRRFSDGGKANGDR